MLSGELNELVLGLSAAHKELEFRKIAYRHYKTRAVKGFAKECSFLQITFESCCLSVVTFFIW